MNVNDVVAHYSMAERFTAAPAIFRRAAISRYSIPSGWATMCACAFEKKAWIPTIRGL